MSAGLWASFWNATQAMATAILLSAPLMASSENSNAPGWNFSKLRQVDSRAEFMGYSHFTSTTAVEAFVRESIQNSLDARRNKDEPVIVHFRFGTASNSARDKFFGGKLEKHLGYSGALVEGDKRRFQKLTSSGKWDQALRYLAVEDWNTVGIEGDHEKGPSKDMNSDGNESESSKKNRFRYFHWAWGQTDTTAASRGGSWGYGKAALNFASQILTIMAVSTKNQTPGDDSTLQQTMMGNSIIRIGSYLGNEYAYYGHYSLITDKDTDDPQRMPLLSNPGNTNDRLEEFKSEFGIKRDISGEQKGLSILVPYPKEEFGPHSVSRAALKSYFAAIHYKNLVIKVSDSDNDIDWTFDNESLSSHLSGNDLQWETDSIGGDRIDPDEIKGFIELMDRVDMKTAITLSSGKPNEMPTWREMIDSLDVGKKKELHANLTNPSEAQTLTFKIDLPLEKSDGSWTRGCFYVNIAQRPEGKSIAFHRHFIRITEDEKKAQIPNGIVANVLIPQKCGDSQNSLHALLRASEGPAHLSWRPAESTVKDNWERPTTVINFVKFSVRNIMKLLSHNDSSEEVRPGWIQTIAPKKGAAKKATGGRGGGVVVITSSAIPMDMQMIPRGINYQIPQETKISNGDRIKIEVAYEIRNGSPWSNHSEWDFDISAGGLSTTISGGKITEKGTNHIVAEVTDKDSFELDISGFDQSLERITRTSLVKK